MKEAYLYERLENKRVRCLLCRHFCVIKDGKRGICGVRENRKGTLYSLVYDLVVSAAIDPIEKKPLYHFLPSSYSLSVATVGCNFDCPHCQNSDISRANEPFGQRIDPKQLASVAISKGCRSISYTYTEPTIFFELVYDASKVAKSMGIKNVLVTNGYMSDQMLDMYLPFLDAANVDLKGMDSKRHKSYLKADPALVTKSIERMKKAGVWVEITTLIVPGINDSKKELEEIAGFIASVDVSIPWHISRFHPSYRMLNVPPTPLNTLLMAAEIGEKNGLKYIYLGNVMDDRYRDTVCPDCSKTLIERRYFSVVSMNIIDGHCIYCDNPVEGVFE